VQSECQDLSTMKVTWGHVLSRATANIWLESGGPRSRQQSLQGTVASLLVNGANARYRRGLRHTGHGLSQVTVF